MNIQPPSPAESDRFAEGRGTCSQCQGPIQKGERFRWRGQGSSLMPICDRCVTRASEERTATAKERK